MDGVLRYHWIMAQVADGRSNVWIGTKLGIHRTRVGQIIAKGPPKEHESELKPFDRRKKHDMLKFVRNCPPPEGASARTGYAIFRCDCGNLKVIRRVYVRNGNNTSCGCKSRNNKATK